MKNFLTVLSIMFTVLFTACSSNGIASAEEEQGPTTREFSCDDIIAQVPHNSYYGTKEEIHATMCLEFKQILRRNGLSNESRAAVECRRVHYRWYGDCYL